MNIVHIQKKCMYTHTLTKTESLKSILVKITYIGRSHAPPMLLVHLPGLMAALPLILLVLSLSDVTRAPSITIISPPEQNKAALTANT